MKLSIVIPALNEEESIASIIERCLNAKDFLTKNSNVSNLEIIVVSDGSTDKTVEIATTYVPQIKLIVFEKNRGYGAAIKKGWEEASGDLLGFIDADGTCDPLFFNNLCNLLVKTNADVVLGCRINKESKMPLIRRIGNFIFAKLLSFLASSKVKDTASGMRVVKKTSLKKLYPLPDGLHFTPAMSAKAMLNHDIIIKEENMPYHEREGESKLNVTKDGIRFLKIILKSSFLYRPQIIFNSFAFVLFFVALLIMFFPIVHYIQFHRVEEWMIYRFIVSEVITVTGILFFSISFILHKTVWLSSSSYLDMSDFKGLAVSFFNSKSTTFLSILFMLFGFSLVFDSVMKRLITGGTTEHWSRYIGFSFFAVAGTIILLTKFVSWVLELVKERLEYLQLDEYKKL